uniref:LOW QUALITY PROTEIN: C2 calcium-dependent domain-containing protein 4A n=1 Tax=Panthera onca TaxID=9690 RepID=UPI002953541B|nr:LOW QUALITY PROTEIN: C2 calcium-dependent domain-containing protein 4A [Panthera onca]
MEGGQVCGWRRARLGLARGNRRPAGTPRGAPGSGLHSAASLSRRRASCHHSQPQPRRMRLLGRLRASTPEPAFSNVLTPDRIPKFCIPPRLPASYAPESPPPAAALPRRCAAEPDLWPRGADDSAGHTDWDPRSQAALSLPHLPRALTAYGFCALLESPHTRRKESLFLGGPAAAPLVPQDSAPASAPALPAGLRPTRDAPAPPRRSRKAAFHQDVCLDGLSEEQVRRLAVRVKAEQRGRGLERGRPLGQGELLLGSLLLP